MGYQAASSGNLSSGALAAKGASGGLGRDKWRATQSHPHSRSGCASPGAGLPGCTGSPLSAGPRGFVAGESKQHPQTPADTSSRGSGSSSLRWKGLCGPEVGICRQRPTHHPSCSNATPYLGPRSPVPAWRTGGGGDGSREQTSSGCCPSPTLRQEGEPPSFSTGALGTT